MASLAPAKSDNKTDVSNFGIWNIVIVSHPEVLRSPPQDLLTDPVCYGGSSHGLFASCDELISKELF